MKVMGTTPLIILGRRGPVNKLMLVVQDGTV
jgi:hypothetical protein